VFLLRISRKRITHQKGEKREKSVRGVDDGKHVKKGPGRSGSERDEIENAMIEGELVDKGFVLPGEFIGTNEEFISGEQTFNSGGKIYAAVTGNVKVNKSKRTIMIKPEVNSLNYIERGDTVIGQVGNIKNMVALVEIVHINGRGEREIVNLEPAAIHISNIKNTYVKEISEELCPFDIVKARVLDVTNMRLTIADKELGVMKAFCSRCRQPLKKTAAGLYCGSCGNKESRKISTDYGTGII